MKLYRKEKPPAGTMRDRSGFLWFPKTIGPLTRWLEFAKWRQSWQAYPCHSQGYVEKWVDFLWDDQPSND